MQEAQADRYKVAIIGAGISGLGMAINLKKAGETDFIVFEREKRVGGTWWVNQYPGCACDVAAPLYSYSFEPFPEWPRLFPEQPDIHAYLERCAEKYGITAHLRLGIAIKTMRFNASSGLWRIEDGNGRRYEAQFVVTGTGALSVPSLPHVDGLATFQGKSFHSQTWDHACDLKDKHVAVIGTGASAIQFVPRIQPLVAHLDLYQRTPPWIVPKLDREMTEQEKRRFRARPAAQKWLRNLIYWTNETRVPGFNSFRPMMKLAERMARRLRDKQIADPVLRAKVTPSYAIGCKRILISNDYYPAIAQPNVEVITDRVTAITPRGVKTAAGERRADVVIFATGFNVAGAIPAGFIVGKSGADLADVWRGGQEAYKGTTVAGFPNLFILLGPNTGLGHNSIIYMIEAQIAYIMDALKIMKKKGARTLEVKREAQKAWNERLQIKLKNTVWNSGGCRSWYLHPETGKNFTIWPGYTWRFRWALSRFDSAAYIIDGKNGIKAVKPAEVEEAALAKT